MEQGARPGKAAAAASASVASKRSKLQLKKKKGGKGKAKKTVKSGGILKKKPKAATKCSLCLKSPQDGPA